MLHREFAGEVFAAGAAIVFRLHVAAVIFLDMAALQHPVTPRAGKAFFHVDGDGGVCVRTGRVIDRHRRLIGAGVQVNLAVRHGEVRQGVGVDLAAGGSGPVVTLGVANSDWLVGLFMAGLHSAARMMQRGRVRAGA